MATKTTVSHLAASALSDDKVSESEVEVKESKKEKVAEFSIEEVTSFSRVVDERGRLVISDSVSRLPSERRVAVYPPNLTDQTHGLSLAEQLSRGQGDASETLSKDAYDFPDGRDDGRDAVGVFAYSEPAELYEAEASFKDTLTARAVAQARQAQADADAAQNKVVSETQKTAQKTAQNEAGDDKSSTSPN